MFHPQSKCLFTVESYDSENKRRSVALSLKSSLFESATDKQWNTFKLKVHELFPYFQPAKGGSGPQRREIPFFVSPAIDDWDTKREQVSQKLANLMQAIDPPAK